mgnify:FL=1
MSKKVTKRRRALLGAMLIEMKVPKEECLEIMTAMDTDEKLMLFLDKLSERNYEATPEEVEELSIEAELEAKYG